MKSKILLIGFGLTLCGSVAAMGWFKSLFTRETHECLICSQPISGTMVMQKTSPFNCNHPGIYYCDMCLARWIKERKNQRQNITCPYCRAPLGGGRTLTPLVRAALTNQEVSPRRRWHFENRTFFENQESNAFHEQHNPVPSISILAYLYRFFTLSHIVLLGNDISSFIYRTSAI